jgi:hypothetical protein
LATHCSADDADGAGAHACSGRYIKGVTHHAISAEVLSKMKPTTHILNMARGEIVDGEALIRMYDNGHNGKYICDFADEFMQSHPNFICIPHLGASTAEAEDNCAFMAAEQIINFLETGTIKNSVNFPAASLERQDSSATRLCVINENKPGLLGQLTTMIGEKGCTLPPPCRCRAAATFVPPWPRRREEPQTLRRAAALVVRSPLPQTTSRSSSTRRRTTSPTT